jgi:hypothetical protein
VVEVTLVYLKKGERPPQGDGKTVIVDCSGSGGAEIDDSPKRMLIRVRHAEAEGVIADLAERGVKKIYVRGMPHA